jgi:hypothetical protein
MVEGFPHALYSRLRVLLFYFAPRRYRNHLRHQSLHLRAAHRLLVHLFLQAGQGKLEELRIKKEMLELEIEKNESQVKLLEAENRKYDRIIDEGGKP